MNTLIPDANGCMPLLGCAAKVKDGCPLETDPSGCEKCKCQTPNYDIIPHYDPIPFDFACDSLKRCKKTCKNGQVFEYSIIINP